MHKKCLNLVFALVICPLWFGSLRAHDFLFGKRTQVSSHVLNRATRSAWHCVSTKGSACVGAVDIVPKTKSEEGK